ncbi:MAG: 4'-phosphopantetheinyl transferase superfamily protein [Acidobacteriota bacterium]|nr:4'-phosphopantetheinyl transferase superfamily protein [Acidobacteriota bacterium]
MILRGLFDDDVEVDEIDPGQVSPARLSCAELAIVGKAVGKRQREFAAGRVAAKAALARLGAPALPLLAGANRDPLWPLGFVGSISHCASLACAAVSKSDRYRSLGCDVEGDEPLSVGVAQRVCSERERDRMGADWLRAAKIVFSAKEAFYKLQFPLTLTFLGFFDADVTLDERNGGLEVALLRDAGTLLAGARFAGRFVVVDGYVATALSLRGGEDGGNPSRPGTC